MYSRGVAYPNIVEEILFVENWAESWGGGRGEGGTHLRDYSNAPKYEYHSIETPGVLEAPGGKGVAGSSILVYTL